MNKKVLLLSAGHLSSCPRLLKEAELLFSNGYEIGIVFLESIDAIAKHDLVIQKENPDWVFYPIFWNGKKSNRLEVIISKLVYKLNTVFNFNSNYIQSTSKVLIDNILKIKADLYIAHHPSVLAAAALAAKKYNSRYSYDIEDAFAYIESFEGNPDKAIISIERKHIVGASIITTASPLYNEIYLNNFPNIKTPIRILNVFDAKDYLGIIYKDRVDYKKLSFYWYSQTIGLNRGLQDLFIAVNALPKDSFELHLRGFYTDEIKYELLNLIESESLRENVFFHKPVSSIELSERNMEHDIGFALELGTSYNREKCISNKILDYIRSGLMIIATNTEGHKYILKDFDNDEYMYDSGNASALSKILLKIINNHEIVRKHKIRSLTLAAEKYNWKLESKPWIEEINHLLK